MSVPDHQVIQLSSRKMKPKRIWIALILGFSLRYRHLQLISIYQLYLK